MAGADGGHGGFKLTTEAYALVARGDDVILPCQLSPQTSASSMTVSWFKESQCIYLYKNGQEVKGKGYEGRLTLDIQELQRGNVSLKLRDCRSDDDGFYICQVQNGDQVVEIAVGFTTYVVGVLGIAWGFAFSNYGRREWAEKLIAEAKQYLNKETAEQKDKRQRSTHVFARAIKQDVGEKVRELETKVEQLTVRLEEKERRDMERMMQLEKTIQTLQGSQQIISQDIKRLTRELENSKNKWQITNQLKEKESELEKINHQLEGAQNKLKSVRVEFINRVSKANLDSLLNQLLDKCVINDLEMESVQYLEPRAEKARAIIDMVRMKGDEASSIMINILEKDQNFRKLL